MGRMDGGREGGVELKGLEEGGMEGGLLLLDFRKPQKHLIKN